MKYITVKLTEYQAQGLYWLIENELNIEQHLVKKSFGTTNTAAKKQAAFLRRLRSKFATAIFEHNEQKSRVS